MFVWSKWTPGGAPLSELLEITVTQFESKGPLFLKYWLTKFKVILVIVVSNNHYMKGTRTTTSRHNDMNQYYDYTDSASTCWLICVNCEYEMSIDECFYDFDEDSLSDEEVECPICKSKQMRREYD